MVNQSEQTNGHKNHKSRTAHLLKSLAKGRPIRTAFTVLRLGHIWCPELVTSVTGFNTS